MDFFKIPPFPRRCGLCALLLFISGWHSACTNRSSIPARLVVSYPPDSAVFPPEIAAPVFRWKDTAAGVSVWNLCIRFANDSDTVKVESVTRSWRPSRCEWERIKARSLESQATLTIRGFRAPGSTRQLSRGTVRFGVSSDSVGDPIFFRDVKLPFVEAVKDLSKIRWRFGTIASPEPPPVVLENLRVCGNCHSFSSNGTTLGMDADYANDKGSYALLSVAPHMFLTPRDIISWADYRRADGELTFGLLSQVSPDGRFAVSTVKDRSVFVPRPDLSYSQLFFPVAGILAFYDKTAKTFTALKGAADPRYVQSNPSWSPDGRFIVFARSDAYKLKRLDDRGAVLLSAAECREFLREGKKFLFDLYRIPFNGGKGGTAEPLTGASRNGKSNYFAKYSPDGRWIVFCQASSFMLLQPDSRLFIIPSQGGEARLMRCNTAAMNSWHSWSSNGRWLVFSSKINGPYTRLCLTHIDSLGFDSPHIVLDWFTEQDRAANIPEFVSLPPSSIVSIAERFVDTLSADRIGLNYRNLLSAQGMNLVEDGKYDEAFQTYSELVRLQPGNARNRFNLGVVLMYKGEKERAREQFLRVIPLDPRNPRPYLMLGIIEAESGRRDKAGIYAKKALEVRPGFEGAEKLLDRLRNAD